MYCLITEMLEYSYGSETRENISGTKSETSYSWLEIVPGV